MRPGGVGDQCSDQRDSHCWISVTSSEQLSHDHNSVTGFLLYTMLLWSGSCPGLEGADTSLETELSWA